jgi:beta-xylosidase
MSTSAKWTSRQVVACLLVKIIATYEQEKKVCEGSHMFKKDGQYYLITANGGTETNHQEWVYKSEKGPFGPWTPGPLGVNPLVFNDKHKEIQQTGHMDLVEGSDGRWWAVILAVRPVRREKGGELSHLGRETFLAPVGWKDEWPVVNMRKPITIEGDASAGLTRKSQHFKEEYKFEPGMDMTLAGWYTLRTPWKPEHSVDERPGHLALRGGPYDIHHDECNTAFFQKQTAFEGEHCTTIDYPDIEAEHEAGVTIWWSKMAFASLGVRGSNGSRVLVFRSPGLNSEQVESRGAEQSLTSGNRNPDQ